MMDMDDVIQEILDALSALESRFEANGDADLFERDFYVLEDRYTEEYGDDVAEIFWPYYDEHGAFCGGGDV